MGIFTWTDATYKRPRCNKYGDYADKYVVLYGEYAKLVCPDDTEIETNHHDFYGRIGMHDIYDLVVDWNKADLHRLFSEMEANHFGRNLWELAVMFADGNPEEDITEYVRKKYGNDSYLVTDWKRNIGIAIACDDKDAKKLKYPIKLTKDRNAHGYNNLYISYSTQ